MNRTSNPQQRTKVTGNVVCGVCGKAWWSINGRYCGRIERYVEHEATPPCLYRWYDPPK